MHAPDGYGTKFDTTQKKRAAKAALFIRFGWLIRKAYGPVPVDVLVLVDVVVTGGVTGQDAPVCVGVHDVSVPGVPLPLFDNTTTSPATTSAPPATASHVPWSNSWAF